MTKNANTLKSGVDYPRNWNEFLKWFHDERDCLDYIYKIRWPDGFVCPACNIATIPYALKNGTLKCPSCKKETSITARTIFNKTRTPLKDWFGAVWYITNKDRSRAAAT